MRIIGGTLKGQIVHVPVKIRPTQAKVREAFFSILTEKVIGSRFLDLFAGSGIMGLEAISRGARDCWWIENDMEVLRVLKKNVERLTRDFSDHIIMGDVFGTVKRRLEGIFDIIYADPPYKEMEHENYSKISKLLKVILDNRLVDPTSIVAIELRNSKILVKEVDGWEIVKEREYGDTKIVLFKVKI